MSLNFATYFDKIRGDTFIFQVTGHRVHALCDFEGE